MIILIVATWQGQTEEKILAVAKTIDDAKALRAEYQKAYGFEWNVIIKRFKRKCGGFNVCWRPYTCDCKRRLRQCQESASRLQ